MKRYKGLVVYFGMKILLLFALRQGAQWYLTHHEAQDVV